MNIFNFFSKKIIDSQYFISYESESGVEVEKLVYSSRSLSRESKILNRLLLEAQDKNKKLIWISPFHQEIYSSLKKEFIENLIWISICNFSEIIEVENNSIIYTEELFISFTNDVNRKDKFTIQFHSSLLGLEKFRCIKNYIESGIYKSAERLKTIEFFENKWKFNFRRNLNKWLKVDSVIRSNQNIPKPDVFILGGKSVDKYLKNLVFDNQIIWVADTALYPLLKKGMIPNLVFSIDAGKGSFEHFISILNDRQVKNKIKKINIFLDVFSFPKLFDIPFNNVLSYANSNPLLYSINHNHTFLSNETSDVFGIMMSLYKELFGSEFLGSILGHEMKHTSYITHLRGSAYYNYQNNMSDRLNSIEKYFFNLSYRYK